MSEQGGSSEKRGVRWGSFLAGMLWGITVAFIFGVLYLRHSVLREYRSEFGFEQTVSTIMQSADRLPGWSPRFSSSCTLPETSDGTRVAIIELCHSKHASALLDDEQTRKTAAVIPCTIAVYQKSDGTTYVSMLDLSLLGSFLGGRAAGVLTMEISPDHRAIVDSVTQNPAASR